MPKAKIQNEGLLDTWGRRNRKYEDRKCPECGKSFKPLRGRSRYCSRPCMWKNNGKNQKRKQESWWKNQKGYIEGRLWLPDGTQIKIKQHRFIMEGIIGRPLAITEDVHHKDGNKSNNDPSNLVLIDHGEHSRRSNRNRIHKKGYKLNLSEAERKARSLRAIASQLDKMGRAAIRAATGE